MSIVLRIARDRVMRERGVGSTNAKCMKCEGEVDVDVLDLVF